MSDIRTLKFQRSPLSLPKKPYPTYSTISMTLNLIFLQHLKFSFQANVCSQMMQRENGRVFMVLASGKVFRGEVKRGQLRKEKR